MRVKVSFLLLLGTILSLYSINIKNAEASKSILSSLISAEKEILPHFRSHLRPIFNTSKLYVWSQSKEIEPMGDYYLMEKRNITHDYGHTKPDVAASGAEDGVTVRSRNKKTDVLIIGGGQSGLAVSYFLQRKGLVS